MVDFERKEHELGEDEAHTFYGFESEAKNQMYKLDRWLGYLLDPGDEAEPVSEQYKERTAALNMFGLHLVDEILELEDGEEEIEEYREDIRDLTSLGYSEDVRMYAEDILNQLEE